MAVQAAHQVEEDRRLTGRGGDAMKGPRRPAPKASISYDRVSARWQMPLHPAAAAGALYRKNGCYELMNPPGLRGAPLAAARRDDSRRGGSDRWLVKPKTRARSRSKRRKQGRRVRLRSGAAIWRRSAIASKSGEVRVRSSLPPTRTAPLVAITIRAGYRQAFETNEFVRTKFWGGTGR